MDIENPNTNAEQTATEAILSVIFYPYNVPTINLKSQW